MFKGEEFGYSTITVERPLQLRFVPREDNVEQVMISKTVEKLKIAEQTAIRAALSGLIGWEYKDRDGFITELKDALRKAGMKTPPAPIIKAIWNIIGEHDDAATVITNAKGQPEPDPALRDTENVPLTEDIEDYFKREILPHVPDAWVDDTKTKVGYEIPFTRHFYRYTPPRPLEEIQKDLRTLVAEIQEMLKVVGA